jgi:hypothetical protein
MGYMRGLKALGLVAAAICLMFGWLQVSASGHEQTQVKIKGCFSGGGGTLRVLSPAPGEVISGPVVVRIHTTCGAPNRAVPYRIQVDGAAYYSRGLNSAGKGLFVVHKKDNDGYCCQTGGAEHRLRVSPGPHVLTVLGGYQGTGLPGFPPVKIPFSVSDESMPFTGSRPGFTRAGLLLIGIGGLLWLGDLRRGRRRRGASNY